MSNLLNSQIIASWRNLSSSFEDIVTRMERNALELDDAQSRDKVIAAHYRAQGARYAFNVMNNQAANALQEIKAANGNAPAAD